MKERLKDFSKKSTVNHIEFSKKSRQQVMQRISGINKKSRYASWGKRALSATALIMLLIIPGYFVIDSLQNQTSNPDENVPDVEKNPPVNDEEPEITPETPPVEELENRYRDMVINQEIDGLEVVNYDSMNELVNAFTEVMSQSLAEQTADDYFREDDGNLYVNESGGPAFLNAESDYDLTEISNTQYELAQTTKTEQSGQFRINITYQYQDDRWIIQERKVNYSANQ
ncbi:hypothetical protein [Lentibacillus amyloliquefaciens]|uniref:Uncharacterized protein n=1 Tax=Lentibacillus amyloliquefaciens TaxID=1472767 RepID=A0A0U4FEC3_9BACI|nr:hypothetical protein [Lentibacillus amyloliquefaciens]ALX48877.1 hypothetical protein AOX59_09785 [Lentibacillus amyloliquefaciens]